MNIYLRREWRVSIYEEKKTNAIDWGYRRHGEGKRKRKKEHWQRAYILITSCVRSIPSSSSSANQQTILFGLRRTTSTVVANAVRGTVDDEWRREQASEGEREREREKKKKKKKNEQTSLYAREKEFFFSLLLHSILNYDEWTVIVPYSNTHISICLIDTGCEYKRNNLLDRIDLAAFFSCTLTITFCSILLLTSTPWRISLFTYFVYIYLIVEENTINEFEVVIWFMYNFKR